MGEVQLLRPLIIAEFVLWVERCGMRRAAAGRMRLHIQCILTGSKLLGTQLEGLPYAHAMFGCWLAILPWNDSAVCSYVCTVWIIETGRCVELRTCAAAARQCWGLCSSPHDDMGILVSLLNCFAFACQLQDDPLKIQNDGPHF